MKARSGQVALYLALVLVAIAVLVLMNANVFLAVRAKNHATAAGDAAALRAASEQARLLNEIGALNVEYLTAAVNDEMPQADYEDARELRRKCFLGPLDALRESQVAAQNAVSGLDNGGLEQFETAGMDELLRQHAFDIRNVYAQDLDLYPEPWKGAWEEYAQQLELILGNEIVVGPDNCEFADAYEEFPLLDQSFYHAIAGEMWCWFHFNGEWVMDCDSRSMPVPTRRLRQRVHDNSEIYPLHLEIRSLPEHLDEEWRQVIMQLTGCSRADIENSRVLTNGTYKFAFFDSRWSEWSTYANIRFNPGDFPIRGPVKAKYDVLGCAAVGRLYRTVPECLQDSESSGPYVWTAAAKPFGVAINPEGDEDKVTCLKRLVTPVFTDVRLVPVDAVGGSALHTADSEWVNHVRNHIPEYLESGVGGLGNCWYCRQLATWEPTGFRQQGKLWLQSNAGECRRGVQGDSDYYGGTAHAH